MPSQHGKRKPHPFSKSKFKSALDRGLRQEKTLPSHNPHGHAHRGGHALRPPPRPRALSLPGGPQAWPGVPHRSGHPDERPGAGDGVRAGADRAGVREKEGQRREAAGGASVEDLLQREEVRVREQARVWARGVEGTEGGGAHLDGGRGVAGE
ncbi:hypothetical protein E2542_SST05697 [Spatholobus suberectus]|nr:hypothetical protein E2542_SST05697 [Spatholobus suberectus]